MSGAESADISLDELIAPVRRRWKLIAGTAVACGIIAAIFLLLQRPVFTAEVTLTPESSGPSSLSGNLAGLAGLAGLSSLGGSNVSPDFFVAVLDSRELTRATLLTPFPDATSRDSTRLLDILEIDGESEEERLQAGTVALREQTDAEIDRQSGIVTHSVRMPSARLAAAVANRMVELLGEFNLERRQSQSGEQRRFTGERLLEAERELREAERAHLGFLQRNRTYQTSPVLSFEESRLQRDVQVQQELFLTLTQSHEEARIAEVRDTPVLTVIDTAVAPARRTSPRRTIGTLVALVLGGLLGVGIAYAKEGRASARA